MKLFFPLILGCLLCICGCSPDNKEEDIPSYVRIDKTYVNTNYINEGDSSRSIVDCWVGVEGKALGAYELPVSVPVLEGGKKRISIEAGVRENGIINTRLIYPFYTIIDTTLNLIRGKITTFRPVFHYLKSTQLAIKETFEGNPTVWSVRAGPGNTSTITQAKEGEPGFGADRCLQGKVTTDLNTFVVSGPTDSFTQGKPVWAEISFKTDVTLHVGMYIYNITNPYSRDFVDLNPTNGGWRKVYINFTNIIAEEPAGSTFTFYIHAEKASGDQPDNIYLDNIKLLYFE